MATGTAMEVWEERGPRAVATAWELIEEATTRRKGGDGG